MIFILKYSFQHRPSTHQPHNSCKYTPFPIDTQQSWHFFIKKNNKSHHTHCKTGFVDKSEEQGKSANVTAISQLYNHKTVQPYNPKTSLHHHLPTVLNINTFHWGRDRAACEIVDCSGAETGFFVHGVNAC